MCKRLAARGVGRLPIACRPDSRTKRVDSFSIRGRNQGQPAQAGLGRHEQRLSRFVRQIGQQLTPRADGTESVGRPDVETDGQVVVAHSVVILVVPTAPDPDPYTPGALQLLWQDGGTAWVLRDGKREVGTWDLGADGGVNCCLICLTTIVVRAAPIRLAPVAPGSFPFKEEESTFLRLSRNCSGPPAPARA